MFTYNLIEPSPIKSRSNAQHTVLSFLSSERFKL